ncbi:MAG: glycosyltransferase family 39 protein, partial [Candidatus Omnitrophica bacterium]|nr:glycosyltransferase family 39 protein [Candidatus Omnitrophota bacterium]
MIPELPRTPDRSRGVERGVHTALVAALVFFSGVFLYHALRIVAYPYTVDFGEGYLLNHAGELADLRNPYRSLDSPPWLVANYPPVFPLLTAVGVKAFGFQFHFGRALSLLGVLTTGFCLYRMTRFQTEDRFAAIVAGLMWLTAYPIYNWGTHHRVDSVGIAFEALGLLFLLRRDHPRIATLFFLLALYTRQTLWVGPLAGYCYLRRVEGARAAAR